MSTETSATKITTRLVLGSALAMLLLAGPVAVPAHATFPGKNGLIAFSHFAGTSNSSSANHEIALIGLDSPLTPLPSQNPRKDFLPDWSPDGTQIVWWHFGSGGNFDIYKMDADGSSQVNLTSENTGSDLNAAWSPDGQEIVLSSTHQTDDGFAELQVMDADGVTFKRQLTDNGSIVDDWAQFSPDGERIAFASNRSGHFAIYTMDADDGGDVRQLTPDAMEAYLPDFSPDGEQITFTDNICNTCPGSDIWVMDADGGAFRKLTNTPSENNSFRSGFSPNGKKIVFTREPIIDLEPFTTLPADIYVMNANGTGVRNITNSPNFQDRTADWGARVQ